MVVRDQRPEPDDDETTLILTAAHICSVAGLGSGRHRMLHSVAGATQRAGHPLGEVRRSVMSGQVGNSISLDGAVIKPDRRVTVVASASPRAIRDLTDEDLDDFLAVSKVGAASGATYGLLDPIAASVRTREGIQYDGGWWITGDSEPFAKKGDSGAVVLDQDGLAVAILVAIQQQDDPSGDSFCLPLAPILNALAVTLP
jgi:hypothetical protein